MSNSSAEKVAIVTGGNRGLGFSIVRLLCKSFTGGTVYLTARDEARGLEAVKTLEQEGLHPKFHQLDIDNKESIDKIKDFIKTTHGGIDVLINNAGIAFKGSATEPFNVQAEITIRNNFKASLDVCESLFPLLRKHARVVNMISFVGHLSWINGEEPGATEIRKQFASSNLTKDQLVALTDSFLTCVNNGTHFQAGWPNTAYGVSKVALAALGRIYQREFDENRSGEDLLINNVFPGYCATDMCSYKGPMSPDDGAKAVVYAALLEPDKSQNPKGAFIWHDKSIVDWANGPAPTNYS